MGTVFIFALCTDNEYVVRLNESNELLRKRSVYLPVDLR
jgi:hypothetical protein